MARPPRKNLSYRERRVLELRYGLGDEQPRTLADLWEPFRPHTRVLRQIEHRSLRKLRALAETDQLDGVSGDFT
jgi:RNA polymerase primary sigma factor